MFEFLRHLGVQDRQKEDNNQNQPDTRMISTHQCIYFHSKHGSHSLLYKPLVYGHELGDKGLEMINLLAS